MATEFDTQSFREGIKQGVILVDFYTTRCGPCRQMTPVMDKLSADYNIGKVNLDNDFDLGAEYNVSAVPTLVWFKDGQEVRRVVGLQSEAAIRLIFKEVADAVA